MDITKRVGIEIGAKSLPEAGAAFKQIEDRARGVQENMKRTTERVEKLGQGVVMLNRGFSSIVTHGQAAAIAIGGVTGGTKELAETTQKFLGVVTLIEASVITFKGLSFVIQAGASWMAAYAASAGTAAVANAALAKSHAVATAAATAHAQAEAKVAMALWLQSGMMPGGFVRNIGGPGQPRLGGGGGVLMLPAPGGVASPSGGGGFGWGSIGRAAGRTLIGGTIGAYAGEAAGFNPWISGGVSGATAAAAPWIGRGIMAGGQAIGTGMAFHGLSASGAASALGAAALPAAGVVAIAAAGTAIIDAIMHGGIENSSIMLFWDEFFGEGKTRSKKLDQEREMIDKRRALMLEQTNRFSEDYAVTAAGASKQTEIQRLMQGTLAEANAERGLPGRANSATNRIIAEHAKMFLPLLGSSSLRDAAGREHIHQFGQRFREFATTRGMTEAQASSRLDLAKQSLADAENEKFRLANELSRFDQMDEREKTIQMAERADLEKQLLENTQRIFETNRRILDLTREHNRERLETLRGAKQLAEAEEARARSIRRSEEDRQKDLRRQFAQMNPAERRAQERLAEQIQKEMERPGGPNRLIAPQRDMASASPFLRDLYGKYLDRLAEKEDPKWKVFRDKLGIDDVRRRAAEEEKKWEKIKIENENKFTVDIKNDAEQFSKSLAEKLAPILMDIQKQSLDQVVAELARRDAMRRLGMKIAAPK